MEFYNCILPRTRLSNGRVSCGTRGRRNRVTSPVRPSLFSSTRLDTPRTSSHSCSCLPASRVPDDALVTAICLLRALCLPSNVRVRLDWNDDSMALRLNLRNSVLRVTVHRRSRFGRVKSVQRDEEEKAHGARGGRKGCAKMEKEGADDGALKTMRETRRPDVPTPSWGATSRTDAVDSSRLSLARRSKSEDIASVESPRASGERGDVGKTVGVTAAI
ncbi:unnamed protein product [Trichogramma brassicae]|uniref:Uncharacterized protein n=1 Tax=Trichogramma brassicae TaxID=86971 RepID=A0A6H5HZX1_9HYME|nr:unnamed protein product [Trichogramma brassicae]